MNMPRFKDIERGGSEDKGKSKASLFELFKEGDLVA